MPRTDLATLLDLTTPWCVHVVITLRIPEHIANGTTDVHELAAAADCDAIFLRRVLRHLVQKGVFSELEPGQFTLTDTGELLRDESVRLVCDLDGLGGRFAHAWGTLLEAVRTGKPAYEGVFGRPFWEDLDSHPDIRRQFDALMGPAGHGTPSTEITDWSDVRTVVDVGGGTGSLLAEILKAQPQLHGTLVDLPQTVADSAATFAEAGVADRVTIVAQSFYDELPAGADCYILASILNDWPDAEAVAILRRCAEALAPDGRIVVRGGVAADEHAADTLTLEAVLLGGRDRPLEEFGQLADDAGLEVSTAGKTASGPYVVELRRRST
jgi:SAM-dependent methyltransferase